MFCSDEGACVRFGVAGGSDPLAGGNGCGMANHGHDVTMPARPGAQNTKTILGVVVGYSLDEARQHFLGRWLWLWTHADYPGPASRPLKTPKMCCVGTSARATVGYLFAHRCPVQILLQSPAQRA